MEKLYNEIVNAHIINGICVISSEYILSGFTNSNYFKPITNITVLKLIGKLILPETHIELFNNFLKSFVNLKVLDVSGIVVNDIKYFDTLFNNLNVVEIHGLEHWNMSNSISLQYMFSGCKCLKKLNLSTWNTSNVVYFNNMFSSCESLVELNISNWNISNGVDFRNMFLHSRIEELDFLKWNFSNAIILLRMFKNSSIKKISITNWNAQNSVYIYEMFQDCKNLEEINIKGLISKFTLEADSLFKNCTSLTKVNGLENLEVSPKLTLFNFFDNTRIESIDISTWNCSEDTINSGI